MPDFALHAPRSLDEACQALGRYDGEARVIAGGTALVLMIHQGLVDPPALVRLDTVPGLDRIAVEKATPPAQRPSQYSAPHPEGQGERDDEAGSPQAGWEGGEVLRLGALATLRAVAESPLVRERLPVLAGACALVGNVRVRNAATIGGNLCEADYASDPPGVLVALGARVRVVGASGTRELAVADLIQDFYENSLGPDEIVAEVLVPLPPAGARGAYLKYVTRSSEDRPCVGATALVQLDAAGRLADVRVAVGAVAGQPLRLPEVERAARGQTPSDALFAEIGQRYAAAVEPVSDARGSAAYRQRMIAVFVRRALRRALADESGAWKV
ncbi:MAG TPA: FAD binding domain-containing protein [Chloroflexota bacterium]|nr:FAD binding domain-containing protein [Chloroflexota bacterium]